MGERVSEPESDEIKSLTNEVSRLKNENARLMETIDSLKLQLNFVNEEEKVDRPVSYQQVFELISPYLQLTRTDSNVYVSKMEADCYVPTGSAQLVRRVTDQLYYEKVPIVLKT